MITGIALSEFTGFAVRSWPAGEFVADDPDAGELISTHTSPAEAAATAWNLRSISDRQFGVIRLVDGERQSLRTGRDHRPVVETYIDLQNERTKRANDPGPVAA